MKKQSKIIIVAISLLLLVASCVGITAFADGEKGLTVVSQNVEYADNLHLHYAVYPENVDIDGLVLKVYAEDPTANADAKLLATVADHSEVVLSDANGVSYTCRAFKTPGVALKNMTARFYVQAVAKDGTESPIKSYSVAEYFNEMMFGADAEDIADYRDMLEAGDAAQRLLGYYPNDNKDDIPTNYAYVKVSDGAVVGGSNKGLYFKGDEISLVYNGSEDIKTWNLIGVDGNNVKTIAAGKSFTVTENVICVPSTEALPIRGSGVYAEHANTLTYDGITATDLKDNGRLVVGTGSPTFEGSGDENASVVVKDGNEALKLMNATSGSSAAYYALQSANGVYSKGYVFETDIYIESATSTRSNNAFLVFADALTTDTSANNTNTMILKAVDGKYQFVVSDVVADVEAGKWFTLRVEYENCNSSSGEIRYYINGEYIGNTVMKRATTSFKYIRVGLMEKGTCEVYLDNTCFMNLKYE